MQTTIRGTIIDGQGQASDFTQLEWVRRQFREKVGFDPYPGTVNLKVRDSAALALWREEEGIVIEPEGEYCASRCYPVKIAGRILGAWILPQVSGYGEDVMELMAPIAVREALGLHTGSEVLVELLER